MKITQIARAKSGEITEAMRKVAEREKRTPEFIRDGVADGTIVIPANIHHKKLEPIGIGRQLYTKINANIGNSTLSSCPTKELVKLSEAVRYGADTVMDLSTGENIQQIRRSIIDASTVPIGTVPVYETLSRIKNAMDMTPEVILDVIREQAEQGVDYITIHAGLLMEHVPMAKKRLLRIVSRGGSIIAKWMQVHNQENPFYTHFDEILKICAEHDVTLSLGDGMRPGCLADASDEAQFAELRVLAELVRRSRAAGVQAMVEGPGHIPLDQIEMNMKMERELCDDAPFYILGPVVIDCAPGYDHITSSIGATLGAFYGAAMLCYVTPKEHLGLPNAEDVRNGVIAYKIAAHAADVALKRPNARERDDAISRARAEFDWDKQFELALDPARARQLRDEAISEKTAQHQPDSDNRFCTMCGPDFCSMRISKEL
ncbi:MAG: phosphomethylpyrimidine synthase ThiC [Victivallaceae bacterium]|jgi:phosphomethylpyrimidine synthase|nr:phosphomethylpyrimidine synthase ThiC [Victivallaceae bacterium]NLK82571.1 phosphomethylpyrimidine synthase ThiC [Lentisphaerota bacterium]MDD3115829.1 phosphomethylpyrimidine synthase ThiC [Victivallaceae bacterium]MDD3703032.1 phosphomethylpyrimidine synthase ThiC [Victivallaceae bacterium]MDD4316900.1 phosphomethylpyrimidine synthase ThiC [Victivallaceae bacterium]